MREMVCKYVIEKPKALVIGQLLAFWLVSTEHVLFLILLCAMEGMISV